MVGVINLFWNICLLRHGPETVPTRTWFLLLLIAANVALGAIGFVVLVGMPLTLSLSTPLLGLAVTGALTWFALYVKDKEPRFPAAFAALLGCDALISLPMLPALAAADGWPAVQSAFALAFQIWQVVVHGFILGRALEVSLRIGILLAFAMALVGLIVLQATLPAMPVAQ